MKHLALLSLVGTTIGLSSCNLTRVPVAPQGQVAYGLSSDGLLVTFGLDNPDASYTTKAIMGLGGDPLVDLDIRNTDGRLYGVTSGGRVFLVSAENGAATPDSSVALGGQATVAVDFNPVANRLRVAGTNASNFRHSLNAPPAAAAGTTADGTFTYAVTDANAGRNPNIVAAAYTNAFDNSATGAVAPGSTTALYTVDADLDILVLNTVGPQFSTLTTIGALGVNVTAGRTGFDIVGADAAYLSSVTGNDTTLYTVNLGSGAATSKGRLSGLQLKAMALTPAAR